MTLRIRSNASSINAHRHVFTNDINLNKNIEKLSSGLKINRASDGPASLVISEQLRSQIGGVEQAVRNTETDISMIQTTEAALEEVNRMLSQLRQLAVHAANDGVNDRLMLEADQTEVDNILDAIDRVARDTQFGSKNILDGTAGAAGAVTGKGLEFVAATEKTKGSILSGYDVRLFQAATRASVVGTEELTNDLVKNGETLQISSDGLTVSYTGTQEDDVNTMIQRLQYEADRAGMDIELGLTANKEVTVSHKKYGSAHSFKVMSSTEDILSKKANELELIQNGNDIAGSINGETATGEGRYLTAVAGAKNVDGITVRYTGDAGTPDGADIDPGVGLVVGQVHVNQNSLRFQIGHTYDQNKSVSLKNTSSASLAKGVDNASGFKSLRDLNVMDFEKANDSLRLIGKGINEISSIRAELGAFQKNILETNLISLRVARENMISSESVIRDADIAEEMSNLTRNNILSDTSLAMMSHANQQPSKLAQLLQ